VGQEKEDASELVTTDRVAPVLITVKSLATKAHVRVS